MNTCAFLLILAAQIYADGIEGPTGKNGALLPPPGSVSGHCALAKFVVGV